MRPPYSTRGSTFRYRMESSQSTVSRTTSACIRMLLLRFVMRSTSPAASLLPGNAVTTERRDFLVGIGLAALDYKTDARHSWICRGALLISALLFSPKGGASEAMPTPASPAVPFAAVAKANVSHIRLRPEAQ